MEIAIVLSLLVLAIIAFSTEKISVDIVAMTCVLVLVLTGILDYKQAFAPVGRCSNQSTGSANYRCEGKRQ